MRYINENGKIYKYTNTKGKYPIDIWNETAFIFCMIAYIRKFERDFIYLTWQKGTNYETRLSIKVIDECLKKYFPELIIKDCRTKTTYCGFNSKLKHIINFEINKEKYNDKDYKLKLKGFFKLVGLI